MPDHDALLLAQPGRGGRSEFVWAGPNSAASAAEPSRSRPLPTKRLEGIGFSWSYASQGSVVDICVGPGHSQERLEAGLAAKRSVGPGQTLLTAPIVGAVTWGQGGRPAALKLHIGSLQHLPASLRRAAEAVLGAVQACIAQALPVLAPSKQQVQEEDTPAVAAALVAALWVDMLQAAEAVRHSAAQNGFTGVLSLQCASAAGSVFGPGHPVVGALHAALSRAAAAILRASAGGRWEAGGAAWAAAHPLGAQWLHSGGALAHGLVPPVSRLAHLLEVVRLNGHPVGSHEGRGAVGLALAPAAALPAHSPVPNALAVPRMGTMRVEVVAIAPIRASQPIRVSYVDVCSTPQDRASLLRGTFGFEEDPRETALRAAAALCANPSMRQVVASAQVPPPAPFEVLGDPTVLVGALRCGACAAGAVVLGGCKAPTSLAARLTVAGCLVPEPAQEGGGVCELRAAPSDWACIVCGEQVPVAHAERLVSCAEGELLKLSGQSCTAIQASLARAPLSSLHVCHRLRLDAWRLLDVQAVPEARWAVKAEACRQALTILGTVTPLPSAAHALLLASQATALHMLRSTAARGSSVPPVEAVGAAAGAAADMLALVWGESAEGHPLLPRMRQLQRRCSGSSH